MGRRRVSENLSAGGLRGLLDGVCTEQILMKVTMKTSVPTEINTTAHQYVFKIEFFNY